MTMKAVKLKATYVDHLSPYKRRKLKISLSTKPSVTVEQSCPTCLQTYTPKLRSRIVCPVCTVNTCWTCVRRHLATDPIPMCTSCKNVWTPSFICTFAPPYYIDQMRRNQSDVVFTREEDLLEATQSIVEYENALDAYNAKKTSLYEDFVSSLNTFAAAELMGTITDVRKLSAASLVDRLVEREVTDTHYLIAEHAHLQQQYRMLIAHWSTKPRKSTNTYTLPLSFPCPQCRAYIYINPEDHKISCHNCRILVCTMCYTSSTDMLHLCSASRLFHIKTNTLDTTRVCPWCKTLNTFEGKHNIDCEVCCASFDWMSGKQLTAAINIDKPKIIGSVVDAAAIVSSAYYRSGDQMNYLILAIVDHLIEVHSRNETYTLTKITNYTTRWEKMRVLYLKKKLTYSSWRKGVNANLTLTTKFSELYTIAQKYICEAISVLHMYGTNKSSARAVYARFLNLRAYVSYLITQLNKWFGTNYTIDVLGAIRNWPTV